MWFLKSQSPLALPCLKYLNQILLIKVLSRFSLQKHSNLVPSALRMCLVFYTRVVSLCLSCSIDNDSDLKYWAYRNELYKENKKLGEILELIFSNAPGKEKSMEWMLLHVHPG